MTSVFKALGLALVALIGVFVAFTFFWFFIVIVGLMVVMFGLAWLVDARFKITQNGKHVGYYKRSTGFVRKL